MMMVVMVMAAALLIIVMVMMMMMASAVFLTLMIMYYSPLFVVDVGMALMAGTSEESAYLVGKQIGNNIEALLEMEGYPLDMMCLHDAHHHLLVDSEWNVDFGALDDGGPVLVADGVAKFKRDAYDGVRVAVGHPLKVDYHHRIQFDAKHGGGARLGVIGDDVAVGYLAVAHKSHRIFFSAQTLGQEAALLGCPLVEGDVIDVKTVCLFSPFGLTVDIA